MFIFITLLIIRTYSFFSGFIPIAINFLRRLPIIGSLLLLPGIRQVSFSHSLEMIRCTTKYSNDCFRSWIDSVRVDQWCEKVHLDKSWRLNALHVCLFVVIFFLCLSWKKLKVQNRDRTRMISAIDDFFDHLDFRWFVPNSA